MTSTLLVGGSVYSSEDPFATALLVSDGTIAWLGSDEAARALARAGEGPSGGAGAPLRVVELDGGLVTPAFVDAAAHVMTLARQVEGPSAVRDVLAAAAASGVAALHVVDAGPEDTERLEDLGRDPGLPLAVWCGPGAGAGADPAWCRQRALDPDLADAGVVRGILAARATAVLGRAAAGSHPLASAAAAGVPLALGSGRPVERAVGAGDGVRAWLDPWATVRAASVGPDPGTRISSRAAFAAHTRGGWRAGPPTGTTQGRITVGAPATLAVWSAGELTVEAPDPRVAAWSTDPRAGTPLLPRLQGEGPRVPTPRCLLTFRNGVVLYAGPGMPAPPHDL